MDIKDIKTIALDIDGTLINSKNELTPLTKKALIEVQNSGVHLILASGRPVKSMLRLAEELELDKHKGIIISNNGSIGFDTKNSKIIYDTPIPHDVVVEILKSLENRNIWPMIEEGDYMLVKDVYKGTVDYLGQPLNVTKREAREGGFLLKEVQPIENYVEHNVNKILTIVEPSEVEETVREFRELFGDKVHVVQTAPFYMEFVMPQANKSYALEKLGIDKDSLISFGDSMNDKEMLEYSKYPVAMGNAMEPLKEIAYYITEDNDSEGVYEALKHFGFVE